MSAADDLLSETYRRFMKNWTIIVSLRQVSDVALPIAEEALATVHADYINRIAEDPEYQKIIVKADGSPSGWDRATKEQIQTAITDLAVNNARAAIDAASLVFAQSILDDCVLSYLRVCALAAPEDWDQYFKDRKIAFSELGKTREQLRAELIESKIEQLGWESIARRIETLFQLCKPPAGFAPIGNYAYDRERLEKIDKRRQAIIHKDGLGDPIETIANDLEYVSKTVNFLMALVNQKYGARLNLIRLFNLPVPPGFLGEE